VRHNHHREPDDYADVNGDVPSVIEPIDADAINADG
jgi:hypothetical protein